MTPPATLQRFGCDNWENHSQAPTGVLQWHAWAAEKSKTHKQIKCKGCGLYQIWIPKVTDLAEKALKEYEQTFKDLSD